MSPQKRKDYRKPREPKQPFVSAATVTECVTKEQRVDWIVRLMQNFAWQGPRSTTQLANTWRVSESTVKQAAAEAGRHVGFAVAGRPHEIRQEILATLQMVTTRCLAEKKYALVISATERIARMMGMDAPIKTEITGAGGAPLLTAGIVLPAEDAPYTPVPNVAPPTSAIVDDGAAPPPPAPAPTRPSLASLVFSEEKKP